MSVSSGHHLAPTSITHLMPTTLSFKQMTCLSIFQNHYALPFQHTASVASDSIKRLFAVISVILSLMCDEAISGLANWVRAVFCERSTVLRSRRRRLILWMGGETFSRKIEWEENYFKTIRTSVVIVFLLWSTWNFMPQPAALKAGILGISLNWVSKIHMSQLAQNDAILCKKLHEHNYMHKTEKS